MRGSNDWRNIPGASGAVQKPCSDGVGAKIPSPSTTPSPKPVAAAMVCVLPLCLITGLMVDVTPQLRNTNHSHPGEPTVMEDISRKREKK